MPRTRPLDFYELRVLGALMEKEQATPDHYPLTVNSLISACNQKTNREPVTQLTETEVVETLDRLRLDVLTWRSDGARVERWEHRLDRRWHLTPQRKALMTLLMLRGPQTPGELKSRSERLHSFDSVGEVEATLADLAAGDEDSLVRELQRRPGQRENRWGHIVGDEDFEAAPEGAVVEPDRPAEPAAPRGPSAMDRIETLETQVGELTSKLEALTGELLALRRRLGDLDVEDSDSE